MTEAADTTAPQTHEEILSRLSPEVRRMADRDPIVRAMFTPEFLQAAKKLLEEAGY